MDIFVFANVVLDLVLIVVIVKFATQLHKTTQQMNNIISRDLENTKRLEATVDRMEAATKVVAKNLAQSVSRADAAEGEDGSAADAALRSE